MGNAAEWAKEIEADLAKEIEGVRADFIDLVQTGVNRIVDRSPVKTGHFKGNWVVSIGMPDGGVLEVTDKDGAETKAAAAALLATYPADSSFPVVYIQNNERYAEDLEHGKSDKAPLGMVAITAVELSAIWGARSK